MYTISKITIISISSKEKFETLQKLNQNQITDPIKRSEALAPFGENQYISLKGHWKEQSIRNYLNRMKLGGHIEAVHTCLNISKGGGWDEKRFEFDL